MSPTVAFVVGLLVAAVVIGIALPAAKTSRPKPVYYYCVSSNHGSQETCHRGP